jgi:hypothetical protein
MKDGFYSSIPIDLSTAARNVHTFGFQEWNESFKFQIKFQKISKIIGFNGAFNFAGCTNTTLALTNSASNDPTFHFSVAPVYHSLPSFSSTIHPIQWLQLNHE